MDINIVLLVIIAANVMVSLKGFNDISFFRKYEFHVGSIRAGEQYRMFTSAFLHADVMHLAFNMLTLYFFAPAVIYYMGVLSFVLVYFGSLVSGSLLSLYFHRNDYAYRAIGASGAVVGVVYSAIMFNPDANLYLFFALPIPAYLFGIGYLLYSIYGMRAKNDSIGHTAHFGGAIAGYLITLAYAPVLLHTQTLMVILLAIPIVLLFILEKSGKL
jgi:membrane associated rhomboid family serine protease